MIKRLYYTTSVLIGMPNGPGVNEESFYRAANLRNDVEFHPVLVTLYDRERRWRKCIKRIPFFLWIDSQFRDFFSLLAIRTKIRDGDICMFRVGPLPLGTILGTFGTSSFLHLKTVGDIGFIGYRLRNAQRWHPLWMVHRLNILMWKKLSSHAKFIDVCTPELKNLLGDYLGEEVKRRIVVIPNGILSERFTKFARTKHREETFTPIIGYVGGLPLKRGGTEVITLVRALRDKGILAEGLIVGQDKDQLIEYASSLEVAAFVRCTGVVPPDRVPELMTQIDIGLALDDGERHIRVGNSYQKVSQYLASGCFVITKNCSDQELGSLKSIRTVSSIKTEDLMVQVEYFIGLDPAFRDELRDQSKKFIENERSIDGLIGRRLALHTSRPS